MACFTKSKTESGKNQENVETNGNILSLSNNRSTRMYTSTYVQRYSKFKNL